MLIPHIPRHSARYLGTRHAGGAPVHLGRLAARGRVTLWLDEGGAHFQRADEAGPFLIPRRCLQRAEVRRRLLGHVLELHWTGPDDAPWVSAFVSRSAAQWRDAVRLLREATQVWARESRDISRAPHN